MSMDSGVKGKLVLVTGSTSGIGKAIAIAYAKAGSRVIINGRSDKSVNAAVEDIRSRVDASAGYELLPVAADVGTAEGCASLLSAVDALGTLEVLVCNVGVFEVKPFEEISDDEWQRYYDVNVLSCVRLSRHWLPKMLSHGWGRIILISSEVASRPLAHMIPYSVSKASQVNLARGLAELTKGTAVTVNSVLPGPTWTEGVEKYMEDFAASRGQTLEEGCKSYFSENETTSLLQRYLKPEEVANVVLFLGSDLGAGVNGNAQRVEGGIIRHI